MDDWTVSAQAPAAASGGADNNPRPVTLTQAGLFMDDFPGAACRVRGLLSTGGHGSDEDASSTVRLSMTGSPPTDARDPFALEAGGASASL
jgi:hypothetical protein